MLDRLTWFRQSALRWQDDERTIYIDPWGTPADAPPADLILITHAHFDHFQPDEIARLTKDGTKVVAPRDVAAELTGDVTAVAPGQAHEIGGLLFSTVPAYNIVEHRLDAHPRENAWVGYVLELPGGAYYHAGDTDHLPELETVRADVAFLPIGDGPYTMGPQEAGALAKAIGPKLAVPIHFGFVIGSPHDGDRFREAAAPVPVQVMTPHDPFEME